MKKIIILLLVSLFFVSACSTDTSNNLTANEISQTGSEESPTVTETNIYIPVQGLSVEETIKQFFEQQYDSYISLQYMDISSLVDTSQNRIVNPLLWLESLIQRRRLIFENKLCYVETTKFPYTISFGEEVDDRRMQFWQDRGIHNEDEEIIHFRVTGEKGRAYPPFMAVNALHTMRLKQIDGSWKITFHYYPGSSRFRQNTPLVVPSEEEMLADLREEFKTSATSSPAETTIPSIAAAYDAQRAIQYAKTYTESPNPLFYHIEDWVGNCANFTSQCIWYGFGTNAQPSVARRENMTSQWYAGGGGGSPAWESVENFWDYVTTSRGPGVQGLHGEVVESIWQLEIGGIIQTRAGRYRNTEGKYNHNMLLVDKSTLLLAQNTPDSFLYYSDLVNADTRLFNPRYLIK